MQTRYDYLDEARKDLGERVFKSIEANLDNEYYVMIECEVKEGKIISPEVYESLSRGQKYHFTKHYNHRGDKVGN